MEEKRELTLEEIEARCAELADAYESMCKRAEELRIKEEKERHAKLKNEEAERRKEIEELQDVLGKLMSDFYKDYGYYVVTTKPDDYLPINKIIDFFVI